MCSCYREKNVLKGKYVSIRLYVFFTYSIGQCYDPGNLLSVFSWWLSCSRVEYNTRRYKEHSTDS